MLRWRTWKKFADCTCRSRRCFIDISFARGSMASTPKIAVVILNWNGCKDTLECIASVRKIDYPEFEVIVVDNGSTDGSVDAFKRISPSITILETGRNLGYAGGNNIGIEEALRRRAQFVFLLNNDAVVAPAILD